MKLSSVQWNKVQRVKLCCHWFMEVHFPGTSCNLASLWWAVNPLKQNIKLKFCSEISSLILFPSMDLTHQHKNRIFFPLWTMQTMETPLWFQSFDYCPISVIYFTVKYIYICRFFPFGLNVFHWNCPLKVTSDSLIIKAKVLF